MKVRALVVLVVVLRLLVLILVRLLVLILVRLLVLILVHLVVEELMKAIGGEITTLLEVDHLSHLEILEPIVTLVVEE